MPGIGIRCFFALDPFGAEVLGLAESLLKDAERTDVLEGCRFHWMGQAPRPEVEDYWNEFLPQWSLQDPQQEPFRWLDKEEMAPVLKTNAQISALMSSGTGLTWLLDQHLPDQFGQANIESVQLVLVGSLAVPGTEDIVRGFLSGSAEYRGRVSLSIDATETLILGVGHLTSNDTHDPDSRSRAGQAMLALQEDLSKVDPIRNPVTVYVINEQVEPGEGVVLDRRSQVEIGAALGLGLAIEAGMDLEPGKDRPLRLKKLPLLQKTSWGTLDREFDPEHPFAYCGAGSVQLRSTVLQRILATSLIEGVCRQFADSDPDGEFDIGTVAPELVSDEVLAAAEAAAECLSREGFTPDVMPALWTLEGAGGVVDQVIGLTWREAKGIFTADLFPQLALEDWQQSLDDMETFVETGLASRLPGDLKSLKVRVLTALDAGLEVAFRDLSTASWRSPLAFRPRRHARAVLERINAALDVALDNCNRERQTAHRHDEVELESLKQQVVERRRKILDLLQTIPSPQALFLRAVGSIIAFPLLAMAIPFSLGFLDPWPFRLLAGIAVAGLPLGRAYSLAYGAKKQLIAAVQQWVQAQQTEYEARHIDQRFEMIQGLLKEQRRYVEWLLDVEMDVAEEFKVDVSLPGVGTRTPDFAVRRRRFLLEFARSMGDAADGWKELRRHLVSTLHDAKCVEQIPGTTGDGLDFSLLPGSPPLIDVEAPDAEILREELEAVAMGDVGREGCWLVGSISDVTKHWLEDGLMPSGSELLEPDKRKLSPAFQLFDRISRQIARTWRVSLSGVMSDRIKRERAQGKTPGLITFLNRAMGPIDFGDKRRRISLATSTADPLAAVMRPDQVLVIGPEYHCYLSVSYPLSAEEVLYLGDPEGVPSTELGIQTRASQERKKPRP